MNRLIWLLNNNKYLSTIIFFLIYTCAKIVKIDPLIILRTKELEITLPLEYAFGYLFWFIKLKLGRSLPKYNITHLIGDDSLIVNEILINNIQNNKVEKQYFLLQSDPNDPPFKEYIQKKLENTLKKSKKSDTKETNKFSTSAGIESLVFINNLLKKSNITTFLISGTLLGMIRDGGLIEGDNDIDIGVWAEEKNELELYNIVKGTKRFRTISLLPNMLKIVDQNDITIDVFLHHKCENTIWHGTDVHRWYNTPFLLKEFIFEGENFLIPDDVDTYLKENYGNWKEPVLFWDYSFDTPNQRFPHSRRSVFFLTERIQNEMRKKSPDRHKVQTAIVSLQSDFGIDLTHFIGTENNGNVG